MEVKVLLLKPINNCFITGKPNKTEKSYIDRNKNAFFD